MDAGLDLDRSLDADASVPGARPESVADGGNGVARRVRNGNTNGSNGNGTNGNGSKPLAEAQLQHVVTNGNVAAAIDLQRPATIGEIGPTSESRPTGETYERYHGLPARIVKRAFDVIGAAILLVVLAPTWLVIAILIKLDSPGPVLFRSPRIGRDGAGFSMLKFRTMTVGADAERDELRHMSDAPDGIFKIMDDPRLTGIGKFLRRYSMDELPQLLNVIVGQMSLVGPRPLPPEEDALIAEHEFRREVRPGITGPWQVAGSWRIPLQEMISMERRYLRHWSWTKDLGFLLLTVLYVLRGRGT
jgi:lipopolysaccharide/colanic/teichoic acid biosynthesis glycosyltransferase